ncbi:MAG: nicotinate phosphoribosyltransferase [Elusimicrobia bacterium]|nr:nicotinate phosphoribosyltransferase [Elusimicrobiota bacterium]MBD3411661.1 nicotinate phosphoribosyltransferase [Elusimicrobiota bacterium]
MSVDIAHNALFTDFYQLTMAQLYYKTGLHEKKARFEFFFRHYPDYGSHQAGYCVFAGLEWFIQWMQKSRFGKEEINYLKSHKGRSGNPLFAEDFLDWLYGRDMMSGIYMRAVPEGRIVHPQVPLVEAEGGFPMVQMMESSLLNHLNYQTLIATKASRISEAARHQLTIDFGMRRAQGSGANAGARGALIGGIDYTSNTGISYRLGYPPKGTHAHSMVQAFIALGEGELEAFRAYADVYPDDCLLLVDTINTLDSGVPNAIRVFQELRRKGHEPVGIRLDSGDLAHLSIQSAKMLNDAGFEDVKIVLSNQLDEMVVWQIIEQIRTEAGKNRVDPDHLIKRLVYGVGTRLITSAGDAALDGIYKLTAMKERDRWIPAVKLSESAGKIINPGVKDVHRIYDRRGQANADVLCLQGEKLLNKGQLMLHHPVDFSKRRMLPRDYISKTESLLEDIVRDGKQISALPSIDEIRTLRSRDMERLDEGVKRLINPHRYHVSLSEKLWNLKQRSIHDLKQKIQGGVEENL